MRRLINIISGLAIIIMTAVSCEKIDDGKPTIASKLVGEWHFIGMRADGAMLKPEIDIYLSINSDCTFELYQKSGSQNLRYDKYTGTCYTDGNILTGVYSNGKPWGGKYIYAITMDGFTLKSYNLLEEQRYVKATISEDIKTNANLVTRSAGGFGTPIL
jgi:hypothetical protein